jgi:DNA-binding GntR family transcriptional regulator
LIWLVHLAWKSESTTVCLSNAALASYGVSRETKRRALAKLEAAGLIKVERRPGRATIVTLLNT